MPNFPSDDVTAAQPATSPDHVNNKTNNAPRNINLMKTFQSRNLNEVKSNGRSSEFVDSGGGGGVNSISASIKQSLNGVSIKPQGKVYALFLSFGSIRRALIEV